MSAESFCLQQAIGDLGKLPTLPSVAQEVLRVTKSPDATIDELVEAVEIDPVISAKILRLANSSQFAQSRRITTLKQAAVLIGMKAVKLLSLGFALANGLPRNGDAVAFDYTQYWKSSVSTAVAGKSLARKIGSRLGDEAFLCGLLLRIGQLAMATALSEQYDEVVQASPTRLPSADVERRILGFDHYQVGSALLDSWGLPSMYCDTIAALGSASVDGVEDEFQQLAFISDRLAAFVCEPNKSVALSHVRFLLSKTYDLGDDDTQELLASLQSACVDTAAAFDLRPFGPNEFEVMLEDARDEILNISLELVLETGGAGGEQGKAAAESQIDSLTGVASRTDFDAYLTEVVMSNSKAIDPEVVGILMLEIDDFKAIVEDHGSSTGDQILKEVAVCLSNVVPESGFVARYHGEEFAVVVRGFTFPMMSEFAEKLREEVDSRAVELGGSAINITICVGAAGVVPIQKSSDASKLFDLADRCLFRAKQTGQNHCVLLDAAPIC